MILPTLLRAVVLVEDIANNTFTSPPLGLCLALSKEPTRLRALLKSIFSL